MKIRQQALQLKSQSTRAMERTRAFQCVSKRAFQCVSKRAFHCVSKRAFRCVSKTVEVFAAPISFRLKANSCSSWLCMHTWVHTYSPAQAVQACICIHAQREREREQACICIHAQRERGRERDMQMHMYLSLIHI